MCSLPFKVTKPEVTLMVSKFPHVTLHRSCTFSGCQVSWGESHAELPPGQRVSSRRRAFSVILVVVWAEDPSPRIIPTVFWPENTRHNLKAKKTQNIGLFLHAVWVLWRGWRRCRQTRHISWLRLTWHLSLQRESWQKVINTTYSEAIITFCTGESFSCKMEKDFKAAVIRTEQKTRGVYFQFIADIFKHKNTECFHVVVTLSDFSCTDHRPPLPIKSQYLPLKLLGLKAKKGMYDWKAEKSKVINLSGCT